ncbi:MAG: hypothetical protein V1900_00325 [Candidatus Aenigmatarchaeota archaeon]
MRIIDTFLTKSVSIKTNDVYSTALEILAVISKYGKLIERKNIYGTDGPRKMLEMVYEIIKTVDSKSKLKFSFNLMGESHGSGFLELKITCKFRMVSKENGFASETFTDYYTQNVFPSVKNRAEDDAKKIIGEIEKQIKENFVVA